MPSNILDLLIELLVAIAVAGAIIGVNWLQKRKKIPVTLSVFVLLLSLWGGLVIGVGQYLINSTVSQVVAGLLIGFSVVMLSSIIKVDTEVKDSGFARLFGERSAIELDSGKYLIPEQLDLNSRGFERFARVLRSYSHCTTVMCDQRINIKSELGDFLIYDYSNTYRYIFHQVHSEKNVIHLRIEVHPYRKIRVDNEKATILPAASPLKYNQPSDKWLKTFFVPLIDDGDVQKWESQITQWNTLIQNVHATCTMSDLNSFGSPQIIPLVGPHYIEDPELKSIKYAVFTAELQVIDSQKLSLRYSVQNIPHPKEFLYMVWFANDMITGRWTFEMHSFIPILREVLCASTHEDIVAETEDKSLYHVKICIEPRGDNSIIMPYDGVLVSMDAKNKY